MGVLQDTRLHGGTAGHTPHRGTAGHAHTRNLIGVLQDTHTFTGVVQDMLCWLTIDAFITLCPKIYIN